MQLQDILSAALEVTVQEAHQLASVINSAIFWATVVKMSMKHVQQVYSLQYLVILGESIARTF